MIRGRRQGGKLVTDDDDPDALRGGGVTQLDARSDAALSDGAATDKAPRTARGERTLRKILTAALE